MPIFQGYINENFSPESDQSCPNLLRKRHIPSFYKKKNGRLIYTILILSRRYIFLI